MAKACMAKACMAKTCMTGSSKAAEGPEVSGRFSKYSRGAIGEAVAWGGVGGGRVSNDEGKEHVKSASMCAWSILDLFMASMCA